MATPNDLSAFMPSFYKGLHTVQQEQTDLIDAVSMNVELEQAALNQVISYPIAPAATLVNTVLSGVPDVNGDTAGKGTITMTNSKSGWIVYTGEDIRQLQLGGIYSNFYADQAAERIRALRKAVSADIVASAALLGCRAAGTAGTTPFNASENADVRMEDFAACNKIFNDNGSPEGDTARHLILNSTAIQNIQGKMQNLFRANEAGTDKMLRTGNIGTVEGLAVGYDFSLNKKVTPAVSSGNPTLTGSGAIGDVTIPISANGCLPVVGTIGAGTIFSLAGDTEHYYVVQSYANGVITIGTPGLMQAYNSGTVLTFVTAAFQPNVFFTRDAISLVARQPLIATGNTPGGQLMDLHVMSDPRCGLKYQVAMWQNGRSIQIEFAIVWGTAMINPHNCGLLLG